MKVVDGKKGITTDMCFDSVPTKGRPIKQLNEAGKEMVRKLAAVMCTEEEIASVLDVTVEVLHNRLNHDAFLESYKNGKEEGKASLRRTQFELAKKNANMAIWLGKQYLGQKDIVPNETKDETPVQIIVEAEDASNDGAED